MPEIINSDLLANYGAVETNTLAGTGISHKDTDNTQDAVSWTDERLARIIRIRLLTDNMPGIPWDVSYVLGVLKDGTQVRVRVPFYQLGRKTFLSEMYAAASKDGLNLNRLCGGHVRDVLSRLN